MAVLENDTVVVSDDPPNALLSLSACSSLKPSPHSQIMAETGSGKSTRE